MARVQFLYTPGWVTIYISNVLAHLFTTPIPRAEDVRASTLLRIKHCRHLIPLQATRRP
jgi:hypothetical protein